LPSLGALSPVEVSVPRSIPPVRRISMDMIPGATTLIRTIGHSTLPIEEFARVLNGHGVERLVDVRTMPMSRWNPQFNREPLAASLANAGIAYVGMPELGGLRSPRPDSINQAFRNESFRGYADYMQTTAFEAALAGLLEQAGEARVAIMCAEADPARCHRSLIADSLDVRGIAVEHIVGSGPARTHTRTPSARVELGRVTYPSPGLFDETGTGP
jgi:uncharacterized protein (DUF488 family)